MANRVLRDWTTSEKIDKLSPQAELFFVRLIMKADDHGCFHANPKLLKAALFPLREIHDRDISKWLAECVKSTIVQLYDAGGRKYLRIADFGQRLRNMVSKFPQPDDNPLTIVSNPPPETKRKEDETESETETKAREFDDLFLKAFDEATCESYSLAFRGFDLGAELQKFRIKCDNDKSKYYGRDVGGLRTAFQYQLQNLRSNGKHRTTKTTESDIDQAIRDEFNS